MASCRIKWLGRLNSHSPVPGSISDMAVVIGPLCFGLSKVAATLSASPRCARIQPDTALVTGKAQNAAHLAASMSKCAAFSTTPPFMQVAMWGVQPDTRPLVAIKWFTKMSLCAATALYVYCRIC